MKEGKTMADNKSLARAKNNKEDEFYTKITDIEKELKHYRQYFKGAVIFCNCDDPEYSNFWRYFQLNFYEFGIKKLISTHYTAGEPSYKMEIVATDERQQIGIPDYVKTPLQGNGDFKSPECIEILKEADIIITNPPFSLFPEYLQMLIEYEKRFLIVADSDKLHYKEIFPLLQENKMWLGYNYGDMEFVVPDYYEPRETRYREENGVKYRSKGNICWLTNLDIPKRHENLLLYKTYDKEEYPTYINFDAIEVGKVAEIPIDYYGFMGVPDSFLSLHNPEQFELVGLGCGNMAKKIGIGKNHRGRTDVAYLKDGKYKCPYSRIIIKRKVSDTE